MDLILEKGMVLDAAGRDSRPRQTDIAIQGDRIKDTGRLRDVKAAQRIDASGLIVCPGFIDVHSHSDFTLLADGRAESKVRQGVTSEINGNCGISAAPLYGPALEQKESELSELGIRERWNTFREYFSLLQEKGLAVNVATLAGHGNLRAGAAGYTGRRLTMKEKAMEKELLREALKAGAAGLSTGLVYPPGMYADTSELLELTREMKKYGGVFTSHMRSEGNRLLESVDEVLTIAREAGVHTHISHLKTNGPHNWNKITELFGKIGGAEREGLRLTCDRYPYTASSTDLDVLLPDWVFEGGRVEEINRLKRERENIAQDMLGGSKAGMDWDSVVVSAVGNDSRNKWMEGRSMHEISTMRKTAPVDCLIDLLIEEELNVGAIFFSMNEENLISILQHYNTLIGTDSSARGYEGITASGLPHPRGFGTFPRVLGRYVREQGIMSLSEAVYRMTGFPANVFAIRGRGVIAKGYFADITVFDPDAVKDSSDFLTPFRKPEGIHHVIVNGTPVLLNGETTGALPGRVLRKSS